jgi:hypothetical protein
MLRRALTDFVCVLFVFAICDGAAAQSPGVTELIKAMRQPEPPASLSIVHELQSIGSCDHLVFSADGTHLAAVFDGTSIVVWDVATGKPVSAQQLATQERVTALGISADGAQVVVGHPTAPPSTIDVRSGKTIQEYPPVGAEVAVARFTAEGTPVFLDKTGKFHVIGGQPATVQVGSGAPQALAISSDGQLAAAGKDAETKLHFAKRVDGKWQDLSVVAIGGKCAIATSWIAYTDQRKRQLLLVPTDPARGRAACAHRYRFIDSWLAITPDSKTVMLTSYDGHIELIDMATPGFSRVIAINRALRSFAMGPDGLTLAWSDGTQRTVLARLPATLESRRAMTSRTLRQWLTDKKYQALEELFAQFDHDFAPLPWAPNESPQSVLSDLLVLPDGAWEEWPDIARKVNDWMAARPEATLPKLLLADIYVHRAWEARGSGFALTVSPEGWKGFRQNMAEAAHLVAPLCDRDDPPAHALTLLFAIALAADPDEEELAEAEARLFKLYPTALEPNYFRCQKLMQRWGGAPDDLASFATRSAGNLQGPAADGHYARLALSQACYYAREDFIAQSGLDLERTLRGVKHLAEHAPDKQALAVFGLWLSNHHQRPDDFQWFAAKLSNVDIHSVWPPTLRDVRDADYFQRTVGAPPLMETLVASASPLIVADTPARPWGRWFMIGLGAGVAVAIALLMFQRRTLHRAAGTMNKKVLEDILEREGYRPTCYDLEGQQLPERLTLAKQDGRWCVYYSEKGLKSDLRFFESEAEACEYLLAGIRSERTAKR